MRTVNLGEDKLDLQAIINLAREEPVLLLAADGKEFLLAEADDFEKEVETLRGSQAFQRFLDERSACAKRVPLEEVEAEIEQELAAQRKAV
jgi:PHD/YefM family antitoxin component YafN of YafNO toxin-antitoxin module